MIYIHVPFCRSFCTYCDFYSELVRGGCFSGVDDAEWRLFSSYAESLVNEASARADEIRQTIPSPEFPERKDTLYIGGGTPSVLPLDVLKRMVEGVSKAVFGEENHGFTEFTIEVNPEDIITKGPDYLEGLMRLGVNRISMGVQSFDDDILRWMNRRHDSARARSAFEMIRKVGFENVSLDLIYGFTGLSHERWRETLMQAADLAPEHISAYQLSIEEGSALAGMIDDGRYVEPSDEYCREQYDILCQVLAGAEYHHYEISAFARPGYEAVHNSAYWKLHPYSGLGPGAHSAVADSTGEIVQRKWNPDSLCGCGTQEEQQYRGGQEFLSAEERKEERIMLSLRTDNGVDASLLPEGTMRRMIELGELEYSFEGVGNRVRIPEKFLFVSDNIIAALLS